MLAEVVSSHGLLSKYLITQWRWRCTTHIHFQ